MDTKEIITKLKASKLFFDVPSDEVEQLVEDNRGKVTTFQKGEVLIREGETWNYLDVILEGRISVSRLYESGAESQVHLLREYDVIGMEFVRKPDYGSQYYYIAQTEVTIYSIHQWYFTDYRQIGEKVSFQLLKNLISILSHENIRQQRKLDILSTRDMRGRILVYLYYEQKKHRSKEFDIPYTREGLAAFLCVNRSALSRELSRMEKEGMLYTKGKHFILHSDH